MVYDTIILGLGTFGAATAAELAARGHTVLGLEQFAIPNDLGSHHGHSRVFRIAYFEHPDYVPLLRRARERWVAIDRAEGGGVFHPTGVLYAGLRASQTIDGSWRSAKLHGLDVRELSRDDVAAKFPQFRLPEGFTALWESDGGFIVPELAVASLVRTARAHRADLHEHEPATGWSAGAGGVTVRTAKGEYRANRLIITAGAWTSRIAKDLGIPLRVTRQVLAWYSPKKPELFTMPRHPVWAVEDERGMFHYGFPMMPSNPGFKIALHYPGPIADPDTVARGPLPGDQEQTRDALRRYFPDADGELLSLTVCLYTNSPDQHLIIDHHPHHPNVVLACGCSGHGFKFAPLVGEVLADLAMKGRTEHPTGFLRLHRFGAMGGDARPAQ